MKFQGVLRSKKLLRHLTTERPTEVDGSLERLAAIDKWKDEDEAVFFELVIHTTGTACQLIRQFRHGTQGKRAWEVLEEKHEGIGSMATVELVESLMSCKWMEAKTQIISLS